MLVDKLCAVVDLVVDHDEQVLLCVVLGNILVGILLVRHFGWGRRRRRGGEVGRKFGVLCLRCCLVRWRTLASQFVQGVSSAKRTAKSANWTL